MIDHDNEALTAGIRDCWKKEFTMDDPRRIEFFFQNIYKPEYGYADVENGRAVSTVCRIPHAVMFNGRVLQASMLTGRATLPDYRGKNLERGVMHAVLDACEHSELITLIRTEENSDQEQYGFHPVAWRSDYTLTRNDSSRITNFGCAYEPSPVDMLRVYSIFIKRFNCFYARDLEYFANYKKYIAARGGKIAAYYDSRNHIRGYASILTEGREAKMEECIYLDSMALNKMINAALQERASVHLHVSQAENLSMLFPNAPKKDYPAVSARLNDAELFNKLFQCNVSTVEEAFAQSRRPLNINEFF